MLPPINPPRTIRGRQCVPASHTEGPLQEEVCAPGLSSCRGLAGTRLPLQAENFLRTMETWSRPRGFQPGEVGARPSRWGWGRGRARGQGRPLPPLPTVCL